jgi:hypothetical protein
MEKNKWTFKDNFAQIQEFINKNNLTIKYNRQGEVQFTNVKRFAIFNANFPEDIFTDGKVKNKSYLKELGETDRISTYQAIMDQNEWESKDWDYDVDGWWPKPMYKGTVVIPVDTTFLNLVNKDLGEETVSELMDRDKLKQSQSIWDYASKRAGQ